MREKFLFLLFLTSKSFRIHNYKLPLRSDTFFISHAGINFSLLDGASWLKRGRGSVSNCCDAKLKWKIPPCAGVPLLLLMSIFRLIWAWLQPGVNPTWFKCVKISTFISNYIQFHLQKKSFTDTSKYFRQYFTEFNFIQYLTDLPEMKLH